MFNQIMKALKSDDKKRQEEQMIRLESIVNEVKEILQRRGVNYFECMDIFQELHGNLNFQIGGILKQNHDTINKLGKEINELKLKTMNYGLANEPEKNPEQKTA